MSQISLMSDDCDSPCADYDCCPPGTTKDDFDLPDEITVAVSIDSSSSLGMPSDSVVGTCAGGDIYARWTSTSVLAALISGFTVDYTSQEGCCFIYERAGTEDVCGEDTNLIALGPNPFAIKVIADDVDIGVFDGVNTTTTNPDPPPELCCPAPADMTCLEVCGAGYTWSGGTAYIPLTTYGLPSLRICVSSDGNTVSIGLTVYLTLSFDVVTGDSCTYEQPSLWQGLIQDPIGFYPGCEPVSDLVCGDGTTVCDTVGCTVTFSAEPQDLSGVSGATLWEKIQNATWNGTYAYAVCDLGGGCTGHLTETHRDCEVSADCSCLAGDGTTTETDDIPVDQQCIYGSGDCTLSFS